MKGGNIQRNQVKMSEKRSLKKNQNAPRPSEHPPVRREKMSKRLGGIVDRFSFFSFSLLIYLSPCRFLACVCCSQYRYKAEMAKNVSYLYYLLFVLCVCVCVFIKLHITTQSGPVILVILCHSH